VSQFLSLIFDFWIVFKGFRDIVFFEKCKMSHHTSGVVVVVKGYGTISQNDTWVRGGGQKSAKKVSQFT
jgi:hypothetical protein